MNSLFFYNPKLRIKQKFSPLDSVNIHIHSIEDPTIPETHIKRLRHATVLKMISKWFESNGMQVTVSGVSTVRDGDITIVDQKTALSGGADDKQAPHQVHVGDVVVSRTPNADENLYCSEGYIKAYGDEVLRFFLLRSQYRTTIQFTKLQVEDARRSLDRFYRVLKAVPPSSVPLDPKQPHMRRFIEAMQDDFNMLRAVAVMNDLANTVTTSRSPDLAAQLKHMGAYLDVLQGDPGSFLHRPQSRTTQSEPKWSFMKRIELVSIALGKVA